MKITDPTLNALVQSAMELQLLLDHTADDQWRASSSPVPREQVEVKQKGLIHDPTAHTALDPSRLALREARDAADAGLKKATEYLGYVTRKLESAHDWWEGQRPDAA